MCTCLLKLICFSLFISESPGLIRFVYRQKSGLDFNQFTIVFFAHHSPVAYIGGNEVEARIVIMFNLVHTYITFVTEANDLEQLPPFSLLNASVIASSITSCFAI